MAGIEHDERTSISVGFRRRLARLDRCALGGGTVSQCQGSHEAGTVRRNKIEDQSRWLALCRVEHEGFIETHWSLGIEHDARAALHDQAKRNAFTRPRPWSPALAGNLKVVWGRSTTTPVRIRERKDSEIDLSIQVDHEARLLVVSADANIGGHRGRLTLRRERARDRGGLGSDGTCLTECYADQRVQYCNRAWCHESRPF